MSAKQAPDLISRTRSRHEIRGRCRAALAVRYTFDLAHHSPDLTSRHRHPSHATAEPAVVVSSSSLSARYTQNTPQFAIGGGTFIHPAASPVTFT